MTAVHRWIRRVGRLLRRRDVERMMAEEMRYHVDCETAERIAAGMPPEAARAGALRDFGGVERHKEEGRDARGTRTAEDAGRDVRYAARVLRRNPGFTAAIGLTFALGIGATASIVTVVYGVLLRPLPYAEPDRLVALWERHVPRGRERNVVSVSNFERWRKRASAYNGMAALVPRYSTLSGDHAPERIAGAEVSAGYFTLLGVVPAIGRDLHADDTATVVLSDGFWRRRFGGDPGVIGRPLLLSASAYTIVGVMPAGFDPPRFSWLGEQELWFPFIGTPQTRSWGRFLLVVARLKPGVSVESARAELAALANIAETESPNNRGWSATVVSLQEQISGDAKTLLLAALAGVAVLLVLAVTNVATLTLSLMRRREHELAIRRAIGATDTRIFRQLFAQSALLGAFGTAVGLLAAIPGVRVLLMLLPPDLPRAASIALDGPVLIVTTGVAVSATLIFGTVAALGGRSSRASHLEARSSSRVAGRSGGGALVAGEIALALTLAVMAILMTRSFAALRAVDLGFDAGGLVAARLALSSRYDTRDRQIAFFDAVQERFRAVPGVVSTGLVSSRPFSGLGAATVVRDPAQPAPVPGEATVADVRYADTTFFATLRMAFVEGGPFSNDARVHGTPLVVINETLARLLWRAERVAGRRLRVELFDGIVCEIAGVVNDVRLIDNRTPPRPTVYLSAARFASDTRDIMVRVDGDPGAIVPSLRSALASLDPALPLYQVEPMTRLVDAALASDRFATFLLSGFAGAALLLAGVGVFGVFVTDAAARRREIGIRLALGGSKAGVVGLFLQRATRHAAIGVAIGSALAYGLARFLSSLLFGVSPADPTTFFAAAAITLVLAAIATLLPAWQAVQRSPLTALRDG